MPSMISLFPLAKDPDSLQTVNISVISKTECQNGYKAYNIKENMICVGIVPGRRLPCKVMYSQCLVFLFQFIVFCQKDDLVFSFLVGSVGCPSGLQWCALRNPVLCRRLCSES